MGSWFKGEVWGAAPPEALPEQALSSEARRLSIECVCYLLARPGDDSKMQMPNLSRFAGGVTSVIRCCPEVEAASLYREAGCLVTLQQACGHTWNLQQHLQSECRQAGRLRTLRVPPALESCTKPESCVYVLTMTLCARAVCRCCWNMSSCIFQTSTSQNPDQAMKCEECEEIKKRCGAAGYDACRSRELRRRQQCGVLDIGGWIMDVSFTQPRDLRPISLQRRPGLAPTPSENTVCFWDAR